MFFRFLKNLSILKEILRQNRIPFTQQNTFCYRNSTMKNYISIINTPKTTLLITLIPQFLVYPPHLPYNTKHTFIPPRTHKK